MAANTQSRREETETVGNTATTILAHLDMGNEEAAGHLLAATEPRTLGLVINTWYQMCVAARSATITARTARQTMEFFQNIVEDENSDPEDADAAIFTRRLLLHLSNGDTRAYAELWQVIITDEPTLPTTVAARMLGFTRGMLADPSGPDCD